jgi:hypothetical protein
MRAAVLLAGAVLGCASARLAPGEGALLSAHLRSRLIELQPGGDGERFARSGPGSSVGLLQWNADRSSVSAACPRPLLQSIRDEVGRLNQRATEGDVATVAVHVYGCRGQWWWSPPVVQYEFTVLGSTGKHVSFGAGDVELHPRAFQSPADDPVEVVGRELRKRIARSLRR